MVDDNTIDTEKLWYAYQPIVSISSGYVFGYEALLRGFHDAGYPTINSVFDAAYDTNNLHNLEMKLREKAISETANILNETKAKLFFNMDNRILRDSNYKSGFTLDILNKYNVNAELLCIEISEMHELAASEQSLKNLQSYKHKPYMIALDDFGIGYSGLQLLYDQQPNIIKIDRFFINDICRDERKKLFVKSIVDLTHTLGILVVAEGIETQQELLSCKEINCDLAQGYYIARPAKVTELKQVYEIVSDTIKQDRRTAPLSQKLIQKLQDELVIIPTINTTNEMIDVFDKFQKNVDYNFIAVLDERGYPFGVIKETDLKTYIYAPYGKELLKKKQIFDFITSATVCDINTDVDKILTMYSIDSTAVIIVTENFKYLGVLTPDSLLKLINEKNLAFARDQNPLTRLPGNNPILEYINYVIESDEEYILIYFDLNNFKPFNDKFGFRQGDRAILLMAETLKAVFYNEFVGHIGGDDFFVGLKTNSNMAKSSIIDVFRQFQLNMESFYEPEIRKSGFYISEDRDGIIKEFSLLSCSAAMIVMQCGTRNITSNKLISIIADIKKSSKTSTNHIAEFVV